MGKIYNSILELIGNTPILHLNKIEAAEGLKAHLYAKLEGFNPGGSVKDRAALNILAMVFLITPIAVSTEVRIPVRAVVIVFLMLFQLVVVLEFTAVHALAIVFLMTPVAVVTVLRMAVQVVVMVCCICFHMEEVLLPVPDQAVLITLVMADPTWLMPLCIWESFCVITCPI